MLITNSNSPTDKETAEAKARLATLYSNISAVELQLGKTEDLTESVKALEGQQEVLNSFIKDNESVQITLESNRKELDDLNAQILNQKKEGVSALESLTLQIEKATKDLKAAEAENANLVSAHNKILAKLDSEKDALIIENKSIEEKIKALESSFADLQVRYDIEKGNFSTVLGTIKEEEGKLEGLKGEQALLEKSLLDFQAQLNVIKLSIETEEARHNKALESNKLLEDEQVKRLSDVEEALTTREKDLDVKEIHLIKVSKTLQSYKSRLEEFYGKRFEDLIIN